jgi:8-amino-7-oxononanoate synthase
MSLQSRWHSELERLRGEGRFRTLTPPSGIDFSSNDYLGYSKRTWPNVMGGRSGTASRLLRGHHPIWDEVEAALARWHGAEAALVFPSGYAANEGLLATLLEPGDWVASDQRNHASIIDGVRLSKAERFVFRHNDLADLESGLRRAAAARARFIVTESLFGMEGDRAPLGELVALASRYGAHLILDEAHATGCFGATGGGLVDSAGLRSKVLATVHTGGKALGVHGAYVVGSALLKELLVNRCRHLIFTTALPPVVGQWWLEMLPCVAADHAARGGLHGAAQSFRAALLEHGIRGGGSDYIVPLVLREDTLAVEAARRLQAAGLDIRAIRPPTVPEGQAGLRVSIHADHDALTLRRAAREIARVLRPGRPAPAPVLRHTIGPGDDRAANAASGDAP